MIEKSSTDNVGYPFEVAFAAFFLTPQKSSKHVHVLDEGNNRKNGAWMHNGLVIKSEHELANSEHHEFHSHASEKGAD